MSSSFAVPSSKTSSSVSVPAVANKPFCKVCYDAGLPVAEYTKHFVKDQPGPGGKVVCPTLLAQKCLACGIAGHTSSYCPKSRIVVVDSDRSARLREEREQAKKANGGWETVGSDTKSKSKPRIEDFKPKTAAPAAAASTSASTSAASKYGSFGILAVDDSSSSSEDERQEIQKTPAPSRADVPNKPLTWAQRAAAAASKPTPPSSSAHRAVPSPSFSDTRFQLHELCQNIEPNKRASSSKRPSPPVSAVSSMKRKQESVTVPA